MEAAMVEWEVWGWGAAMEWVVTVWVVWGWVECTVEVCMVSSSKAKVSF